MGEMLSKFVDPVLSKLFRIKILLLIGGLKNHCSDCFLFAGFQNGISKICTKLFTKTFLRILSVICLISNSNYIENEHVLIVWITVFTVGYKL